MAVVRSFAMSVDRLESLLLDAEKEVKKRNELASSGANTFRIEASIRKKIELIAVELDALVVTLHQEPSSPRKDSKVQAVKRIEDSLDALERSCSFTRPKSLVDTESKQRPDLSRSTDTELAMMQRKMRESQDSTIDTIALSVENLKVKGTEIGDELDVHMRLLSSLESNVDSQDTKIRRVALKVESLLEKSSDCCLCLTVLGLLLLLVFIGVYL